MAAEQATGRRPLAEANECPLPSCGNTGMKRAGSASARSPSTKGFHDPPRPGTLVLCVEAMLRQLPYKSWTAALFAGVMAAAVTIAGAADNSAEERLRRGEAVAAVSPIADGEGVHVTAAIEVPVAPALVWSIMTSCERAPSYVPGLLSCRVVAADPAGQWDIREHVSSPGWLLPDMRTVFRSEYEPPRRVSVSRVSGDLARSDGEWRLEARNGGSHTRVTYAADVQYDTALPGFMLRRHLRDQMVRVLTALRQECIAGEVP